MQNKRRSRRIDVDLEGTVIFQQASDIKVCVIRNINEECAGVMIATSDPRVCTMENLSLVIVIPSESSPVKCAGKVAWYSEDDDPFQSSAGYAAGVFITDISRIDRRRLELLVSQKSTPLGVGERYRWR